MDKKIIKKQGRYFTQEEQHAIIQEMISNGCSKKEIWKKYTGQEDEHGQLLRWMKKLGYAIVGRPISTKFEGKRKVMPVSDDSFENLQFKKRIFELEKQLKDAELKAIAFSTMIDIAEREFNIPIRKKLNTKP
jgi:transposase